MFYITALWSLPTHAAQKWIHCAPLFKTLALGDFQYLDEKSFLNLTDEQLEELTGKQVYVRTVDKRDAAISQIKIHRLQDMPLPMQEFTTSLLSRAQGLYSQDVNQREVDRRMRRLDDGIPRYPSYEVLGAIALVNQETQTSVPFVSSLKRSEISESEMIEFSSSLKKEIDKVGRTAPLDVHVVHTHPCFSCVSYADIILGHSYIERNLQLPPGSAIHFYAASQRPERINPITIKEVIAGKRRLDPKLDLLPSADFLVEDIR